jgi:predicted transcriptional regulator
MMVLSVERSARMDDVDVVRRISELAAEEHRLEQAHAGTALDDEELERMRAVEVALDQCWDLLRQRRARRDAGVDPDEAVVRPAETVEGYQQ